MAKVSISNVYKFYGAIEVLHGVSIEIEDGEFVVLVGPSGCGKSTLLRMIAGLEAISDGTISVDGLVINDVAPKERDIAMVFQNYALYPHMTVRENMGFSLKLRGSSKSEINAAVEKAAAILGLGPLLERIPRDLSGGQRQRVAMGRAIVRDPKVFLFDEPLSNLDAKLRVQMRTEVKDLHQRLKSTTVYVTHDQIEAMTMADKIVVMHDGIVEQVGTPLELYDKPKNMFVAGFLGSPAMNFIQGTYRSGERPMLDVGEGQLVPIMPQANVADGVKIALGIRPEDVVIDHDDGLPVRVGVIEPTGAETYLFARHHETEIVCVLRERVDLKPGDNIKLSLASPAAHLFDLATTLRLE
ncbi:ABC transporter ATP-binding protein [Roseinatronobacter sp. S2]|uniref:ABC transporter ATP-binding protein n=1 Tax=Roseinatronobacter sp. S2 TaxID=3035471 RepID=UPI0024109659|nr:sn-glycerol-3-phosphate ABC transporter ATP-binding protein UgpC [Roseinatronobacter sp. S2]WFE77020.1 sn-glycerol-3-phosphate ABC transporter ATP-binding protein UgpC [Roseinatronobacter sp. S2]